jgi:outer membrane protein OmpA-like peptidoglycan-associated protein
MCRSANCERRESNLRNLARSFIQLAIAALAIAALANAEEPSAASRTKISDLVFRASDLVFHVEDMGGKIENIAVKETSTEVRIDLAADVLFDFDKADLLPKAQQTLAQAASIIRDKAKGSVRIDGYTDAKGSDAYNQRLSERRAAAVETWFKTQGNLKSISFVVRGFGAKNPVAPNTKADGSDNPEGRKKNRRVEIVIQKVAG